jgi:hypothetical protein
MILLKVYRLDFTSPLYRTLNANYEDRKNAIINSVHDASAFVTDQVRERINQVLYQTETTNRPMAQQWVDLSSVNNRVETHHHSRHALDHSDCAICFDPFNESERANVDYCWVCGNNVHKVDSVLMIIKQVCLMLPYSNA